MTGRTANGRTVPALAAPKFSQPRGSNRAPLPPQAQPRQRKPVIGTSIGLKLNP